jgi:hypothetical protein
MTLGIATAAIRQVNRVVEPVVKAGAGSLLLVGPALVVLEIPRLQCGSEETAGTERPPCTTAGLST